MDIIASRLASQKLTGEKFEKVQDVVRWFGAVQSQDFPAAKWSLGLRLKNATDEMIQKAYEEGKIVRTHIMRPTWHFVLPEDVYWMQKLTSHRVKQLMNHYNKKLELTDELFKKTNKLIEKSLSAGIYLTRQELKKIINNSGIPTDVQRLAHIVSWAELDGLIVNGSMRGKHTTYALLSNHAAKQKKLSREESLGELALRYFQSHGPAQLKDFAWWSGLTIKEAGEAVSLLKSRLSSETIGGKAYFYTRSQTANSQPPTALLMSVYDEYFIGYTDRSEILAKDNPKLPVGNALLTSLIIIDGKVKGSWRRNINNKNIEVKLNPFDKLSKMQEKRLIEIAQSYGEFFGKKATYVFG